VVPSADTVPLPNLKLLKLDSDARLDHQLVRRWLLSMDKLETIELAGVWLSRKGYHNWRYVFEAIRDHSNAIYLDFDQITSNDWTEFSCGTLVPAKHKSNDPPPEPDVVELEEEENGKDMLMDLDKNFEKYMAGHIAWNSSKPLVWFFQ
jgi:hypothetical protein